MNQQCYVEGIERGPKNCFIVLVPNQNAETLARIISENVPSGSKIITDKWRAYVKVFIFMPDLEHKSDNHSLNFVDTGDLTIHNLNIEGLSSRSKYFYVKERECL